MHLYDLVNLATKVIDYVQEATLCSYKDLGDLPRLLRRFCIFYHFEGTARVVEDFTSSCVVQRNELARQEVVLDFEEANILFSTTD